jgi:hypothetical protein
MSPGGLLRREGMDRPLPPGARVTVVARRDGRGVVIAELSGLRPDLELIDRLARLQLAAAQLGIAVRYSDPCPTLRSVIELTGLDETLLAPSVEPVGEPELGEVPGVEEVGPGGDPAV